VTQFALTPARYQVGGGAIWSRNVDVPSVNLPTPRTNVLHALSAVTKFESATSCCCVFARDPCVDCRADWVEERADWVEERADWVEERADWVEERAERVLDSDACVPASDARVAASDERVDAILISRARTR
jgi:hypothetical protein